MKCYFLIIVCVAKIPFLYSSQVAECPSLGCATALSEDHLNELWQYAQNQPEDKQEEFFYNQVAQDIMQMSGYGAYFDNQSFQEDHILQDDGYVPDDNRKEIIKES